MRIFVVYTFSLIFLSVYMSKITCSQQLELLLYHSNNIYSHFEENDEGIGGAWRVLHILREAKQNALQKIGPPVLYLNAGDNFGGSLLYRRHKWKMVADFLNVLKPDVMCLGNHDFDEGPVNLTKFLRHITFPVVGANINVAKEWDLLGLIKPYHVLSVENWTIAVIGYTTTRTKTSSNPGRIEFTDEIEAVRNESKRLRKMGAQVIIALGHAGPLVDEKLANEVEDVDVIVGGHRKSWTMKNSKHLKRHLPQVRLRKDNKKVIIVHEPGYLKYLGMVRILFDESGDVLKYSGAPILLNSEIPQSRSVLDAVSKKYEADDEKFLATSRVTLSGKCLASECNMANLVVDAFCQYHLSTTAGGGLTKYPLAVINSGAFRTTINKTDSGRNITKKVLSRILHFDDYVCLMIVKGKYLRQALEESVLWEGESTGELLQVSGIHVKYNFVRKVGTRVTRLYVRCGFCEMPRYRPVLSEQSYGLITTYYVSQGIDGHMGISQYKEQFVKLNIGTLEIVEAYFKTHKNIWHDAENRLVIELKCGKLTVAVKLLFISFIIEFF